MEQEVRSLKGSAVANIKIIATVISLITGIIFLAHYIFPEKEYLKGEWEIEFTNSHASLERYIGMTLTYKMSFTQNGKEYHAVGETYYVNGKELPFSRRRNLSVNGNVDERNITGSYLLKGAKRESTGYFEAVISEDGTQFEGTFTGSAANTKGKIHGVRKQVK